MKREEPTMDQERKRFEAEQYGALTDSPRGWAVWEVADPENAYLVGENMTEAHAKLVTELLNARFPDAKPWEPPVSLIGRECERCGTLITAERCEDETCPFSDYPQGDSRGWTGHPNPPN